MGAVNRLGRAGLLLLGGAISALGCGSSVGQTPSGAAGAGSGGAGGGAQAGANVGGTSARSPSVSGNGGAGGGAARGRTPPPGWLPLAGPAAATPARGVDCKSGSRCDNGKCAPAPRSEPVMPPSAAGQPCDAAGQCAFNLYCNRNDATCTALPKSGEACVGFACASGSYCPDKLTCQPSPGMGQPCGLNLYSGLRDVCGPTFVCDYDQ